MQTRFLINRTNSSYALTIGGANVVLHPFKDRNPNSNSTTCFVVVDKVQPEDRSHIDSFIARRFLAAAEPAEIVGISQNNVHLAQRAGGKDNKKVTINPLNTLPAGLAPKFTLEVLKQMFPEALSPEQKEAVTTGTAGGQGAGGKTTKNAA